MEYIALYGHLTRRPHRPATVVSMSRPIISGFGRRMVMIGPQCCQRGVCNLVCRAYSNPCDILDRHDHQKHFRIYRCFMDIIVQLIERDGEIVAAQRRGGVARADGGGRAGLGA